MSKEIKLGHEARTKIKAGIDKAVNAVLPTLGKVGMSAVIEFNGLDPIIADDGVTVMRNLEFSDRYENMGMMLARKIATQTSSKAGDGTSTASCLGQAIAHEAFKRVGKKDQNIPKVVRELEEGLEEAKSILNTMRREVGEDDIRKIATVSSLDSEIGALLEAMIGEVGTDGVITAESSPTVGYSSEVVKGARFNSGFITPYLVTDPEHARCDIEDVVVVLVGRNVSINKQIAPLFEHLLENGKTRVLLIADDIEGEALASLVMNHQRKAFQIACVKNPYTATRSREFLEDIAVLTGATVISEQNGLKLEDATVEQCGTAERVTSTEEETTIVGGGGKEEDIDSRAKSIDMKLKETEVEHDRDNLQERIATLKGGIGVIRVGAYTETELKAKKYKIENAINSTKSALEEGVLVGGGIAMKQVSEMTNSPIFRKALKAPIKQMAKNAGMSVKEFEKQVDPYEVMDSHKVQRLALENAVSIAKQAVTIGTAIVTEE